MTPIPENALPNYNKRTIEDPSAFFRTLFHLRDIKEERAIPAVVKDYDAKTGEVTVLPMAKYTFDTRDGEAEVDRETVKVRALKICQGGYSISLPIFKGDTGWLIAGDRRCGAAIEKNGEIVVRDLTDEELKDRTAKPDDCSLLNFENGFFVPFSWELEDAEKNPNGNFVIRNARDKICEKELENEFGVVRDDKGDDVPFIEDLNGKTHSIDGVYHGRYAWSMIEIQRDGMVNAYGQGRKFTVRKEGLYLDDKPLKFLDDLILKEGEGIEIEKTVLKDGKIQFAIGNKGVITLENGDNITIEPVEGKPGTFRISSSGGSGTLKSITIDSPDRSVDVEKDGTEEDPQFHLKVTHPTVGNGAITIKRNGVAIGSFTMNQSDDGFINIEVPVLSVDKKTNTFGLDVNPTTGDVKIENTGLTGLHVQQSGQNKYAQITGGTDAKHGDVDVKTKDVTLTLPIPQSIVATNTEEENKVDAIVVDINSKGNVEDLDAEEEVKLFLDKSKANTSIKTHDGSELGKVFGDGNDITLPQAETLQGSDYIDIPTTGTDAGKVKAKVPTDGSKGLVTTDTTQTIAGVKTFEKTILAKSGGIQIETKTGHNFALRPTGATNTGLSLLLDNSVSGTNVILQADDSGQLTIGSSDKDVVLRRTTTDDEETTSKKIPSLGLVNDKFLRIANLVQGENITITPDATNPKKLTIAATGGATLDHSFSWEGEKKADIAASANIAVDSKKIQGSGGIDVTEENRVITIKGNGEISGYITPEGTYDYEVTGLEWDSTNHRILIHKVKKTYENGLLKTRESVTDEYIQFVEETA